MAKHQANEWQRGIAARGRIQKVTRANLGKKGGGFAIGGRGGYFKGAPDRVIGRCGGRTWVKTWAGRTAGENRMGHVRDPMERVVQSCLGAAWIGGDRSGGPLPWFLSKSW